MGTRTAVPMACPPPDLGGKGHNAVGGTCQSSLFPNTMGAMAPVEQGKALRASPCPIGVSMYL